MKQPQVIETLCSAKRSLIAPRFLFSSTDFKTSAPDLPVSNCRRVKPIKTEVRWREEPVSASRIQGVRNKRPSRHGSFPERDGGGERQCAASEKNGERSLEGPPNG